jgi:hypothetical protein
MKSMYAIASCMSNVMDLDTDRFAGATRLQRGCDSSSHPHY